MQEERMNVGVVLTTSLEKWRSIEAFIAANAEIVFVKKVPPAVRLRVKQEIIREEGEKENVRPERS